MKPKKFTPKQLERQRHAEIQRAYAAHFDRIEINIMSIPKIYRECEARMSAGEQIDEVMKSLVPKYAVGR